MTKPFYQSKNLAVDEGELRDRLLPLLREHVFHVTSHDRFRLIEEACLIKANSDGVLGNTYPQSARSFGRQNGYVCLFDLRNKSDEVIQWGLDCFYFLAPRPLGDNLVFLILSPESYTRPLRWEDVRPTADSAAFRIPDIECWYPTNLPLSETQCALFVHVIRDPLPPDSLSAKMLAATEELAREQRHGT